MRMMYYSGNDTGIIREKKEIRVTLILTLLWYYSWLQSLYDRNQIPPFDQIRRGRQAYLKYPRSAHITFRLLTSSLGVNDVWLGQKRTWHRTKSKTVTTATAQWASFCVLLEVHYWYQVWAASLQYFPRFPWFCDLSLYWDDLWRHQFLNKNLKTSGTRETLLLVTLKGLLNKNKFFFTP